MDAPAQRIVASVPWGSASFGRSTEQCVMLETIRSFFDPPISADPTHTTAKLAWIVRLRWIAVLAQALSIGPALEFGLLEPHLLPVFVGAIALLATLNVTTWAALRRGRGASRPGRILFQLVADISVVSTLLALTGGAWNPLVPILFVHTGLGALLLEGRLSLIFFALLIACLAALQAASHIPPGLEGALIPATMLFPAQLLVALVFWILMSWLSRTLGSLQSHFAFLSERKTRIDRLRAVGALAAGLSHEFATPLNTAQLKLARLARTRNLENDEDLATATAALRHCEETLRHMAGSQLRPEGLHLESVDLDSLVQRVCSSVSSSHEGASIRFASEGRASHRALLPSIAFSQAVINLIDNALKAGGGQRVEVVVASHTGHMDVSVLDRGEGWPDVVRRHLGEPFVTTRPDGVGLGLYYVNTLAEAMGAKLSLEDRERGGAIARISVPALQVGSEVGATA